MSCVVLADSHFPWVIVSAGNVLLLKNVISLNPDASEVSQQKLLSLVAERLIDSNVQVRFNLARLRLWFCLQSVFEWFVVRFIG